MEIIEWFKSLNVAWQTTFFAAFVAVAIPTLSWVLKTGVRRKKGTGRNSDDIVQSTLETLNTALQVINSDQSNRLKAELKEYPQNKLSITDDKALLLEKELHVYAEIWKALKELKATIVISPSVDVTPSGKSPYEVYEERFDTAIAAFNKSNALVENNRPFLHDSVTSGIDELLGTCRGYLIKIRRTLQSHTFNDQLHDDADDLLELIPKIVNEIENAIKLRIGLVSNESTGSKISLGPNLGSVMQIVKGSIIYDKNTLEFKPFIGLQMSIVGGFLKRNDFGKLEALIQTEVPFVLLQRLNERLGLDSMRMLSDDTAISIDCNKPTIFTCTGEHVLPQGEMALNLLTWQEVPIPVTMHVRTQTTASGCLQGKVFKGQFKAAISYQETGFQIGMTGVFEVHIA